jgi:hypothetical protein
MPTPFSPYKPTNVNSLLSNPFSEKPLSGNAFGTKPLGSTLMQDSPLTITTKDPIYTTKTPFSFTNKSPSQMQWEARKRLNENLIVQKTEAENVKQNWWSKKSKKQKTMIIGGSVLAVAVISYLAYKKYSKKG